MVQKRTYFKGNYDRVLSVSQSGIATQMPNLQGTNMYSMSPEFNVRSITFEKDGCLTLQARPDNKRNAEKTTVHTTHVSELACALYEAFALNAKAILASAETQIRLVDTCFPGAKLKKGRWVPCTLRVTNVAIERLDHMLAVQWRARFVDLRAPGIVLLDDTADGGTGGRAFKVCAVGNRGQRIYACQDAGSLAKLVASTARECLGATVAVTSAGGSAAEHAAARAGACVEQSARPSHVPLHEFWVARVKVPPPFWLAGRGAEGAEDGVGRFGAFPRHARLFSLSAGAVTEKGADGRYVSRLHDLKTVAALVAFEWACEARLFAIEWTDRSPPTVYETNRRSRAVALLLEAAQAAKGAAVPVLPDLSWPCRKLVGRLGAPAPTIAPADAVDGDLEGAVWEQLQNAAGAVHDEVCRNRIIAFEAAAAAAPPPLPKKAPEMPVAPKIGEGLPELPPTRVMDLDDFRLEEVFDDTSVLAKAHWERAKVLGGQVAANAQVTALRLGAQLRENLQAARDAAEKADVLGRAQRALAEALAPAGEADIPDAHAFLVERLAEFNATVPYEGFSQPFLDAANRPGRFDRETRRKAYATLEAIFCLLPEPKKAGERRLRPDVRQSLILITALHALQRLASCVQLQEEMCSLRMFPCTFSLLECGCERVSMEAARLLTRLWAPVAWRTGAKPFVNKSAGEEYLLSNPEDALQVKANKQFCFEKESMQAHASALVAGLVASAGNEALCAALVEAVAALVAEPEYRNTPAGVQTLVKELLAADGTALLRLMATPVARIQDGVMAVVREALAISADAAWPIRDAALAEGIILKHLLLALRPEPTGSKDVAKATRIVASREFVQRLVEGHPPTQALLQRIFPAALLSLLRKPFEEGPTTSGAPAATGGLNWPLFWKVTTTENHSLAGLVWDEHTRYDLRTRLEAEDQAIADARKAGKQPVWNHKEFSVSFVPPAHVLTIGGVHVTYLLHNAADPRAVESIQDPRGFFEKLYFHLVFALAGIEPARLEGGKAGRIAREQELCVQAMAATYSAHAAAIGACKCLPYLVAVLDETRSSPLREQLLLLLAALVRPAALADSAVAAKACAAAAENADEIMRSGGVRLLLDVAAMAHLQTAPYSGDAGGPALLMDAAQSDVDAVASWWYYVGELPEGEVPLETAEPPGAGDEGVVKGPLPCTRLIDQLRSGALPVSTPVWAAGMPAPRPACTVRQLRWLLGSGAGGVKWALLARAALSTLLAIFELAPSGTREPGCTLVPLPRVVRLASEPAALAAAAQLLLTQDSELVASASALLLAVARANSAAAARLYRTGLFFFALAYVGRDLGPLSELLAATHTVQMFQGAVDPAAWAARPVGERSILGTLLPESLLYQLEAYGPAAFAAQMTRQVDDPEVLWSQAMREEELLPAVHGHLGPLTLRLRDNVAACYDYAPMPPMSYKALKGELWCFRYYLAKLCEPEHRSHPIVEHTRFRNELVAELRKEMAREASESLSSAEALTLMGLSPADIGGATADETADTLRRAYRRRALALHPDKNPEGPEPFLRMQAAYNTLLALAHGEAEEGGGPRPHRVTLLIRALCLLHRRAPDVLGEFTFPAYDAVLSLLHAALDAHGMAHAHVMLALELIWLTLLACPENAPFLGDRGAVPVFMALLARALDALPADAPPSADAAVVATLALRALALVLRSPDARAAVAAADAAQRAPFLRGVLRATRLSRATNVVGAATDATASLACSPALHADLVSHGALGHVMLRMLLFNETEAVDASFDVHALRGTTAASELSAKQKAALEVVGAPMPDNQVAFKAAAALRALCGSGEATPHGGACAVRQATRALLTAHPYALLDAGGAGLTELLATLTGERSTPLVIWSARMRGQLLSQLERQVAEPEAAEAHIAELGERWSYEELADELAVRDVYVRLYVDDPEFAGLTDRAADLFVGLFERAHAAVCPPAAAGTASHTDVFRPAARCAWEAEPDSAERARERAHLATTLKAAEALVASPLYAPLVQPVMPSLPVLAPLVCWALKPAVQEPPAASPPLGRPGGATARGPTATALVRSAAEAALRLLDQGTRLPDVKAAMCADTAGDGSAPKPPPLCRHLVRALACAVHEPSSDAAQSTALEVLAALTDSSEVSRLVLEDGAYVLLLATVLRRPPAASPPAERERSAHVRGRVVAALHALLTQQSIYSKRLESALGQLLPSAQIAGIKHAVNDEAAFVTSQIDTPVDSAELVWTADMHERAEEAVGRVASSVLSAIRSFGAEEWRWRGEWAVVYPELEYDLFVGGVYLKRFLDTSRSSASRELRDPAAFFDGLMTELNGNMATLTGGASSGAALLPSDSGEDTISRSELLLMLGRAAELVLGRYPDLPAYAARQGYVEWLVARLPSLPEDDASRAVGGIALRVLLQLALSPASAQRLAAPTPPLVPAMVATTRWNLAAAIFSLDIVRCALHDANPDRDEVARQAVVHGFVPQLLGLLEPESNAPGGLAPPGYIARAGTDADMQAKADSDYVRNLAVEIIHILSRSDDHGEQVSEILAGYSEIWQKHQRHSGVISATNAADGRPAPVATLLRGPTSAATFALPAAPAKDVKFLTSAEFAARQVRAKEAVKGSAQARGRTGPASAPSEDANGRAEAAGAGAGAAASTASSSMAGSMPDPAAPNLSASAAPKPAFPPPGRPVPAGKATHVSDPFGITKVLVPPAAPSAPDHQEEFDPFAASGPVQPPAPAPVQTPSAKDPIADFDPLG